MSAPKHGLYFVFDSKEKMNTNTKKICDIIFEQYGKRSIKEYTPRYVISNISLETNSTPNFDIETANCSNGFLYLSVTTFRSFFLYETEKKIEEQRTHDKFFEVFQRICTELQPLAGYFNNDAMLWESLAEPSISKFEYYNDPYFFTVDPLWTVSKAPWPATDVFDYLTDSKVIKELEENKKILPEKILFQIVSKNTLKTFSTPNGGLGCYKHNAGVCASEGFIYPRYYVREKLREYGVHCDLSESEFTYYYLHKKEYPEKVFDIFKQIIREGNEQLTNEGLYFPLFNLNFKKACEIYKFAYRNAQNTVKKDLILKRFFYVLSWKNARKKDVAKQFPSYHAYNERYHLSGSSMPEYTEMKTKALDELRDYLEKD